MDIKVNRQDLQKAVGITRKALSKIIIQQERGHLLFSVSDGKMRVTGTNNDLKALCIIGAECAPGTHASFTCDPKILSNVLTKMDLADVTLDYDENDQSIKVYTNEGGSSFAKLQSFPPKMMLTFEPNANRTSVAVSRQMLSSALKYAVRYLSPLKDDGRNFDIVTISKGVMYAANGSNMMGFMVSGAFKPLDNMRLRKVIIPIMSSVLDSVEDLTVGVIESGGDTGIETAGGVYFSALKPAMEPPSVPTQHVKSEGAHTIVDRALFIKYLDRLVASHTGTPDVIGVQMTLGGAGDSSYIDLSLLSSKSIERVPCARADDRSSSEITHMVEYKILKSILSSFEHGEKIRLHINDDGGKFIKAYDKGEVDKEAFIQVGIGGYAKRASGG